MMEGLELAFDHWLFMRIVSLRLNGGTSCTSVLPELMSYLSMRFVRAVKNLPEYNSAEDIEPPQKMYKLFVSLL